MNNYGQKAVLVAGLLALLLTTISCGQPDLPDPPTLETLGFADSLDAVRQQVLGMYELWQEQPLDAERNGRLAMHLSAYGKSAAAEVFYRRARALAADEFRWAYYLAFTLIDQGRSDEATAMFRAALKLEPGIVSSDQCRFSRPH